MRQVDLAERLGVPQSFITKIETRKRRADFAEVVAILDALGVSVEEAARLVRGR